MYRGVRVCWDRKLIGQLQRGVANCKLERDKSLSRFSAI